MRKTFPMLFLVIALDSSAARAQGIQNFDIFIAGGATWNQSHTTNGSSVTLANSWGGSFQTDYGYQFARASAASLLLDVALIFPSQLKANAPLSSSTSWFAATLGLRLMLPVNSRLSFYAVSGGGPRFLGSETHGVFTFGGGADVRLTRWFSLRTEVRDLVTGRDLSGAAGPHHVLPMLGVALHY